MSARPPAPASVQTWGRLRSVITARLDEYRRQVTAATGLPFSRIRALRRLAPGPLTPSALAEAMMVDRPAATVAVDDLCALGLVARRPHPTDRRCKLIELTDEGRRTFALVEAQVPPPPPGWSSLSPADLAVLRRILDILDAADG